MESEFVHGQTPTSGDLEPIETVPIPRVPIKPAGSLMDELW